MIIFSLKHVIVRPIKIIEDLCKASTYIHKCYLCTGFTEVLDNFGRSNDDMVYIAAYVVSCQTRTKNLNVETASRKDLPEVGTVEERKSKSSVAVKFK